jgi:leader peptidase (prepilin peptidase)/N-methyltransferase
LEVFNLILIILLSASIGSFLNVLIVRLPLKKDIVVLKSHCVHCQTPLKWYHNIPIISFLFLKGKCAYCKKKIDTHYILVEIACVCLTLLLYFKWQLSYEFFITSVLFYALLVLCFIDFKYKAVPDYLLLFVLVLVFFTSNFAVIEQFQNAFMFAGAFALLSFVVTFYIQNIKSKLTHNEALKEQTALGEGDIPIVAVLAALLGIQGGLVAVFLAAFFAIMPALYNTLIKKEQETPFIPFLFLGMIVEYFFTISKGFN